MNIHTPPVPRLRLFLLGPFQVILDGQQITSFQSDKVRALFAYIAMRAGQPHRRDALAGLFWPELPQEAALRNLRQVVYALRQALGEGEQGEPPSSANFRTVPFLMVNSQVVQFNPGSDFQLDVTKFRQLISACKTHRHRRVEACTSCKERLQYAATLYRGDFLAGFGLGDCADFEEWLMLEQEELRHQILHAYANLASYSEARGHCEEALDYARLQIKAEPWREAAHRQAMRLLWQMGRRGAAMAQYKACRTTLLQEFGIEPTAETTELFRCIADSDADGPSASEGTGHLPGPTSGQQYLPLPARLSSFVGRKEEMQQIVEWLDDPDRRLLSLIGPGGAGKSRLATEALHAYGGTFRQGARFVALATTTREALASDLVSSDIARATGAPITGEQDATVQLLNYLAEKEMLLVLDNFEQLIGPSNLAEQDDPPNVTTGPDGVDLLMRILQAAPQVKILVTSRVRLGLRAESVLETWGLSVPPDTAGEDIAVHHDGEAGSAVEETTGAGYGAYDSVQLFVERARSTLPGFSLTSENVTSVARICRQIVGLPLAIEIAAGWVRTFSCREIADSIARNLDFVATTMRDMPPQHRSLRAVFAHSWELLSEVEKRLLRRLSVFRRGWEPEAAQQVADAETHILSALEHKSLLWRDLDGRYGMHEMVRQYASEKLGEEAEEQAATLLRHAEYYTRLAEAAEEQSTGPQEGVVLQQLERERGNIGAALEWTTAGPEEDDRALPGIALAKGGETTSLRISKPLALAVRLGACLWYYWHMCGDYVQGRSRLAAVSARADHECLSSFDQDLLLHAPPDIMSALSSYAMVLRGAGALARMQADYPAAQTHLRKSVHMWERLIEAADKSEDKAGSAEYHAGMGNTLNIQAIVSHDHGDYTQAVSLYSRAIDMVRHVGNKQDLARFTVNMGIALREQGDYARARTLFEEGLALQRQTSNSMGEALSLLSLGMVAWYQGDYAPARKYLAESLVMSKELGYKKGIADCLEGLARVAASAGQEELAASLWGTAEALRDELGSPIPPGDLADYERNIATAKARMDTEEWSVAWAKGRTRTIEEAMANALQFAG